MISSARIALAAIALTSAVAAPAVAADRTPPSKPDSPLQTLAAGKLNGLPPMRPHGESRHLKVRPPTRRGDSVRARAASFVYGAGSYCYGKTVSSGGGGLMVISLATHTSFGYAYGTQVQWRPWVYWSNASGSGWFTNQGWRSYKVLADGNTASGQGVTIDPNGNAVLTIGGTSVPGTWTFADPIPIASRTWAMPAIQIYVNGTYRTIILTPDHVTFPAMISGDWCSFA
jgi:hypothetical protein